VPRPTTGGGQSVAYTGTAGTIATAFPANTYKIAVWSSTDAHIQIDKDPTATTSDLAIPANSIILFNAREGMKVSAVQVASGGTLYVGTVHD
jgi:hypothetical protein